MPPAPQHPKVHPLCLESGRVVPKPLRVTWPEAGLALLPFDHLSPLAQPGLQHQTQPEALNHLSPRWGQRSVCCPLPVSGLPLPFSQAKLLERRAEHACHDESNCKEPLQVPPGPQQEHLMLSRCSVAIPAPAPQVSPGPGGLEGRTWCLPFSGRWWERAWYLRKCLEAPCGPQDRASREMCLCGPYEHPTSLL